ncbi:3-carboxy-cis,cis-muconate cycloisomerase [Actinocrispum wychmicini]|uniref:3-carboxy-cis,cis-muconate cycloisomerase n=1 Tax=Actinocrispum wychmicini TaxID=1213861 RepID=A0A4R2J5U4_9PSEU|nr:3-carboxy-cis,cis-muconate cycloisomerase [Actinocrispum wychmicini]TCO54293.1 3-carboxy-cis,cis-muconate cycloisomerase [Actinocrispum wychmicini]
MSDHGVFSPGWAGTGVDDLVSAAEFVRAMLAVETALARAQAKFGVIPATAAEAIAAVTADAIDIDALAEGVRATANPVVSFVAQLGSAVDPDAAEYVHRGCTSQDVLDSALMLLCRRVLTRIVDDLVRCADALAALAARHRDTVQVGRTLTQHAVPVTFGLKVATWLNLVLDALARCRAARDSTPASLGGAAGTLSAYAEYATLAGAAQGGGVELMDAFAAELDLRAPLVPWHSVRTPIVDVASALAFVGGALGKFAIDVQVLARTEIAEVVEPAAPSRGASSTMPQKHNPVLATLIVTSARQLPSYTGILYASMMSEDERSAGGWHAEWQPLRECLRLAAGAAANAAELAEGLTALPDRMRDNLALTGSAVVSERLNTVLAPMIGKVAAKALLTEVADAAAKSGDDLVVLLCQGLRQRGHSVTEADLGQYASPDHYLGAAPVLVDRTLQRHQAERSAL